MSAADDIRFRRDPDGTIWVAVDDVKVICDQAAESMSPGQASAAAAYRSLGEGFAQAAALAMDRHDQRVVSDEMDAESARRRTPDAVLAERFRR